MSKVPFTLPLLRAEKFCPHSEPHPGRHDVWEWIRSSFPTGAETLREQFIKKLDEIMRGACDARDREIICFSDVPSPTSRITKVHYSANEVAAWWAEAVAAMPPKKLFVVQAEQTVEAKSDAVPEPEAASESTGTAPEAEDAPEDDVDIELPRRRARRVLDDLFPI